MRCKNCRKRYFLRFLGPSKIDVSIGIRNEMNDFEGVPKHHKIKFPTLFGMVWVVLSSTCSQTVVNSSNNETHARQVM